MTEYAEDNGFYGRKLRVVVNKVWEADPLVSVLAAATAAAGPSYLPRPDGLTFTPARRTRGLRGYVTVSEQLRTEVWCIEDLLPDNVNKSSSLEKAKVLTPLLDDPKVRLVMASGTAASSPAVPQWQSLNGCVVIGRKAFIHDGNPNAGASHWDPPNPDVVLESALGDGDMRALIDAAALGVNAAPRLLSAPIAPAAEVAVVSDTEYVALSDVNVSDPKMYAHADRATYDAFCTVEKPERAGALDTTLGVVRSCTPDRVPFLFLAGISNRPYLFGEDVVPRPYAQNFVAAHNAAVCVAFLLPALHGHEWPA